MKDLKNNTIIVGLTLLNEPESLNKEIFKIQRF